MIRRFPLSAVILLAAAAISASEAPTGPQAPAGTSAKPAVASKLELTVDAIMQGPRLYGYPPSGLRWSGDSRELYFEWRKPGEDEASTYVVSRDGGEPRKLTDDEKKKVPPPTGGQWDGAHRRLLFSDGGDIVVLDTVARTRQQVTKTMATEGNPRWARGDTSVTFTRDGNLFIMALASGSLQQLTDVGPKRREPRETDSQKYVKAEEQKLIDYTKEQVTKRKDAEEKRKKDALPQFEIQEGQAAVDLMLAPDDEHVFIVVADRSSGAKSADVPNYVTESSYAENIPARSLVGDAQGSRRLGVLSLKTGKAVWADAAFAGTRKTSAPPAGGQAKEAQREVSWSTPVFSPDGKRHVAVVSSADFKDRWIVAVDADSGQTRVVDRLHDDAWIVSEGSGGRGSLGWLPDSARIWYVAERDGWMHLYTLDVSQAGAQPRQLTSGRFEVSVVSLSPDKKRFYFTSSERHPGERHFYAMPLDGGERTQITSMTGSHSAAVSPDDAMLGVVYSCATKPPEVYLMANRKGAEAKKVTTTPTETWRSFKWIDPQVITFKARDGVDVSARLFTPDMIGARRDPSAPGVVFVHGAGYAQNAHKYWSTYSREYMFDNLLASRGYVVLDVDYRASSGYGRDWRTAIYRHMGGKDLDDIVDGAKYLVASQKVSPQRIGVYGGSYGGFITLMAMFTAPGTFAAGAALRPVTDWAHYNHSYTASILNQPQDDGEAYRQSSPIYFAEGLKGALLICHGMVDTNVFFQDSVRLAQRLIELRKENWELAVYPVENHSFEQETSWSDEYRRILNLFETNLRLKPAKAVTR
jgi:dipeptidyl aminopeptidase/acylaminoacyl peptidase